MEYQIKHKAKTRFSNPNLTNFNRMCTYLFNPASRLCKIMNTAKIEIFFNLNGVPKYYFKF